MLDIDFLKKLTSYDWNTKFTPQSAVKFINSLNPSIKCELLGNNEILQLTFPNAEENTSIRILFYLLFLNSDYYFYPRFILKDINEASVDYTNEKHLVLNHLALLMYFLKERIEQFSKVNTAYTGILQMDIQNILETADFTHYSTKNSLFKAQNTIIPIFFDSKKPKKLADYFSKKIKPSDEVWKLLLSDTKGLPVSETAFSESGKIVVPPEFILRKGNTYSVPAYGTNNSADIMSIYKSKPNLPSRLKNFVFSGGKSFSEQNSFKIFLGDDDNCIYGINVLMPIDQNTGKLLCGEIYTSELYQSVVDRKNYNLAIKQLFVSVGQKLPVDKKTGAYMLGVGFDDEIIYLPTGSIDGAEVTLVKSKCLSLIDSYYKLTVEIAICNTAGRMWNFACKGMNYPVKDLGSVSFMGSSYKVNTLQGFNSVKSPDGIKLGFAGFLRFVGLIDSEIDWKDKEFIEKLWVENNNGLVDYTDENGVVHQTVVGVFPWNFNELTSTFSL